MSVSPFGNIYRSMKHAATNKNIVAIRWKEEIWERNLWFCKIIRRTKLFFRKIQTHNAFHENDDGICFGQRPFESRKSMNWCLFAPVQCTEVPLAVGDKRRICISKLTADPSIWKQKTCNEVLHENKFRKALTLTGRCDKRIDDHHKPEMTSNSMCRCVRWNFNEFWLVLVRPVRPVRHWRIVFSEGTSCALNFWTNFERCIWVASLNTVRWLWLWLGNVRVARRRRRSEEKLHNCKSESNVVLIEMQIIRPASCRRRRCRLEHVSLSPAPAQSN